MPPAIEKGDRFRAVDGRVFEAIHHSGGYRTWVRIVAHPGKPHRVGAAHNLPNHWLTEMERVS